MDRRPFITYASRHRKWGGGILPTSPRAPIASAAAFLALALPAAASAAVPTITHETLWEPTPTSIQLNAKLNPEGEPLTDCHFLWGEGSSLDHEATCEGTDETQLVTVGAEAGQFKLTFEGQQTADLAFDVSASEMQAALEALPAIGSGQVSVFLRPELGYYYVVFAGSLATTDVPQISGEDGTEPLSGSIGTYTVSQGGPALEIANSHLTNDFRATALISGLTPATEYSFRLLATNSAGTEAGDVRSFTTLEEPAPETCPNQAFRDNQQADYLPDCRAWEQVSPLDKNNGNIVADGITNIASADGNAVSLSSRAPFGDAIGTAAAGQTQYLARRGPSAWLIRGITPRPDPEAFQTLLAYTSLHLFSDDMSTVALWAYNLPDAVGDIPARINLYLEDTATRALQPITTAALEPLPPNAFSARELLGASADARHLAFASSTRLLPEAAPEVPNVYRYDDGVLSLAGLLPHRSVPAGGSVVLPRGYRAAMSADGSRQLFSSPASGDQQLYMRIGDQRTVWISEPEGSDTSEPLGVYLQAMTPDGHDVFFATESPLLDADTNSGPDLYRWSSGPDPSAETNLTLISDSGQVPGQYNGTAIDGISDDGQVVFYQSALVDPALFVYDHGTTRRIADLPREFSPRRRLALTASEPGLGRLTPDGRYFAFLSAQTLNGNEILGLTGQITNGHSEVYLYESDRDQLLCVTCPAGEASADAEVTPALGTGALSWSYAGIRPRFLADDGHVFFTSAEPLSPADANGVSDVYQYDPATGGLSLLSSGLGAEPAAYVAADADGSDVFFVTRGSYLGADRDELVDLYDARADGGFPEPLPPSESCLGDSCQGALPTPPPAPAFSSDRVTTVRRHRRRCRHPRHHRRPCHRHRSHRHLRTASALRSRR
jgi:hypothetical protein